MSHRLARNFDRLEDVIYRPPTVFEESAPWPGDYPGRTLLTLANLERVTGRKAKYLDDILAGLPECFNERGYLGPVQAGFDEQQLSGHGWLVSGLLAASELRGDPAAARWAQTIVGNLYLPLRGKVATYPTDPALRRHEGAAVGTLDAQVGDWGLSTDIGCAFISLEGLVPAYEISHDPAVKALIEELHAGFSRIDLVATRMQLHASLTAARSLLRHHDTEAHPELLATARRVYATFRGEAITENYANYNWFGRPDSWTEPCAVVDAMILALELWRKTGEAALLDDAHHIYYNALGYAQKSHGGFGVDCCAGGLEGPFLFNRIYDVTWCCNMRGGYGLSCVADYAYLPDGDALLVPFPLSATVHVQFADGSLQLVQDTGYPYEGTSELRIEEAQGDTPRTLRFYAPSWSEPPVVTLNGKQLATEAANGLATVTAKLNKGDVLQVRFPVRLSEAKPINPQTKSGERAFRHGPLVLASRNEDATPTGLTPTQPGTYRNALGDAFGPLDVAINEPDAGSRRRLLFPAAEAC